MGHALLTCAARHPGLQVVAGTDAGDSLEQHLAGADVVIDFTLHHVTAGVAEACARQGKALVIGTTGHNDSEKAAIRAAASRIPIVWASNYSTGVNTLFWLTFVSVTLRLVLGFGLAVFIESDLIRRMHLTVPLRMAALLPWATPDIVAVTVWKQILDGRSGVINNWLMGWGLIDQPIVFLANASYVWPSIITIIVWNGLPLVTLTMAAALQTVPRDLLEAAEIDGANAATRFWHVTFPQVLPALLVLGLLTTIWTFNNFIYVWMSTSAGPGTFSNVLATEVYLQGFVNFKLGLSSAIGTFMAALAMVFGIIYFRQVVLKRFGDLM